jgi:tRNA A-37 threonylcarbamoyl transferase component Bud32
MNHVVEPLPCVLTNLTTAHLARVRLGGTDSGASVIVKIAQSPRHSSTWAEIPEQFREQVIMDLPWRAEADLYASPLASLLPVGMRMPLVYAVDPLGEDRIALWMEDVEERSTAWHHQDYRMAARVLGRLAGQLPAHKVPCQIPVGPRDFRSYFFGRVLHGAMPGLRADSTWAHPFVVDHVDGQLRSDLESLVDAMPALLDRLDDLPRTFVHGDASPQNLLLPAGEPDTVVAIDWTFAGIAALGLDAAQLVAGRAESGELDPTELAEVLDEVVDAYVEGLAETTPNLDRAEVELGVIANLVIRSVFTALPVEMLGDPPTEELRTLFARRAAYTRFLVNLSLDLVGDLTPAC